MRVYLAGAISSKELLTSLDNIRRGIEMAAFLVSDGYYVYAPHLDFLFALTLNGNILDEYHYKENSMAWLEVSDVVFVLPGWEKSKGTRAEIKRAKKLGIPVVFSYKELEELK